MKLQYMKNIFNVADFHMEKVLLTKNFSKAVHVTNKLGRFGTGIPIAPVSNRAVNRQPSFRTEDS